MVVQKFRTYEVFFITGENYAETEEKQTGQNYLTKCVERLQPFRLQPQGAGLYQQAVNSLGVVWTGRKQPEEALQFFTEAEGTYLEYKEVVGGAPWMLDEILSPPQEDRDPEKLEQERMISFESGYTHTLFYYAQVYAQLDKKDLSARYCHKTLQRQLDSHDFDPLDWSLHAATLSQYYMTEREFTMSRHCLASSEVIYQQAESNSEGCSEDRKEKLTQAKADIQRCWAKYGLGLLEASREKLYSEADETEENRPESEMSLNMEKTESSLQSEKPTSAASGSSELPVENGRESNEKVGNDIADTGDKETSNDQIEVNKTENEVKKEQIEKIQERFNLEVTAHEEKVSDQPVKCFDEARELYLYVKRCLESAKDFYKFEIHCPDYVAVVQDHSLAFKLLAFFEMDFERQCKMHKRRIDMLSEILKELNPQHYLLIVRQLMYEIADTYSQILDLKLAILESSDNARPTPHNIKKINLLASQGIKYYQEYLNTLKGGKPMYPDEFPENDVRPGLIAMFCMGRLYSKLIAGDIQTKLLNIKKTKDCYQFPVDYCKRNPGSRELVKTEIEICEEMVVLLPHKMEKLRQQSEM